jgi:hypothetical protein
VYSYLFSDIRAAGKKQEIIQSSQPHRLGRAACPRLVLITKQLALKRSTAHGFQLIKLPRLNHSIYATSQVGKGGLPPLWDQYQITCIEKISLLKVSPLIKSFNLVNLTGWEGRLAPALSFVALVIGSPSQLFNRPRKLLGIIWPPPILIDE